jgi:hypothetical protein
MKRILLTGAGFTRNWGGWLADEVFEYLLGDPALDREMRRLLWDTKDRGGGFEAALATVSSDADRRRVLESALGRMFQAMNGALARQEFLQTTSFNYDIMSFLPKFDAIFTLNQDLFLEHNYLDEEAMYGPYRERWEGYDMPGVRPGPEKFIEGKRQPRFIECEPLDDPAAFKLDPKRQPYVKLHGSSNWYRRETVEGQALRTLLIMGGDKATGIAGDPLLHWNLAQFRDQLNQPDARLMIIGYGFGDEHINKILMDAAGRDLRIFIVDPRGVDVLDKKDPRQIIGPGKTELMSQLRSVTIGASRRSLREIFAGDETGFANLMRFFDK